MTEALAWLNWTVTGFFSVLFRPFRSLDPLWPLAFTSLLTAVLMLGVYRRISDQEAIRAVRDRLRGHLLALRLYRHDSVVTLRVQRSVVRDTGTYLRLSFVPLLVMAVPLMAILSQLDLRFSRRPLAPGESATVTVRLATQSGDSPDTELVASPGTRIETPPVRIPSRQEVSWRIRAETEGEAWVNVRFRSQDFRKTVAAGGRWKEAQPVRGSGGFAALLNPGEPPLPSAGPLRSIEIAYQRLPIRVFGWETDWLVTYLLSTLLMALLLKRPMGVEF